MSTNTKDVGYVLGQQIGSDFKNQGISIDLESFFDSFKNAYNGEPSKMSQEEMATVMQAFQTEMQAKHQEKMMAEAAVNLEAGTKFLDNNKNAEGITTLESGLQYRVVTKGSGKKPAATDTVETHYEGKLIDGNVFDSSYQRGETTKFPVNAVIPGWTEALQLMEEGSKWELFIPASLAYGEAGSPPVIGPNSTLIFDVELISVC
jgi:FKBP-type peptidyl-prolyl cis-trans isomerase FklB